jgi:Cu(I)/Ag(I) efflux system membrane fusion protein/cobalt-zinc-cadmium efflux system membrane fusion protein
MSERSLKGWLAFAVLLCVGLAGALGFVVWQQKSGRPVAQRKGEGDPVIAQGPAVPGGSAKQPMQGTTAEPVLAPVQLTAQRMQEIGVTTAVAEMRNVGSDLDAPGNVTMDEQKIAYVQTRFPGWIRSVYANATYQYVKKGQRLFTIYSPDLVSTEQEYLLAKQNLQSGTMQQAGHEGMAHMHGMAANEGNWMLQAAEERLKRYDLPATELARMEQSGKVEQEIAVESPVSGYIIERNALPNAYVQPETKLYTVADLSTVWVVANVFQNDAGRVKPGDAAEVTVDAYPGRKFAGRVDQILPEMDVATRTVKVRLVFANPAVVLKPGMYVNVRIHAPLGRQLVVPASSVLQSGARQIVFLDRGQGTLEPREVETGARVDDAVAVLKGLKAGDRVVSSANFLIDSEAQLQGAAGGFAPMQQTPGAQGAQGKAEDLRIEMSTEPAQPRRGNNVVHVKVTGGDGKPVSGAAMQVTFYMPAMAEMGMAAQRVNANLRESAAGMYEAPVELDSGGTWNVTVTVQRNGQTVATKKLSVNATGGMA